MIDRPSADAIPATAHVASAGPTRRPRRLGPVAQWATAALILGLAACGGNDDDGDQAPVAVTDLAINTANADRVAGEAIHSVALLSSGIQSVVANNFVLDVAPPTAAVRSRLLRVAPAGGGIRPQAVSSRSTPCATSGQATITVSQAVERKLSVGDFAEEQFDACVQAGIESVGKVLETVTAVNDTPGIFEAHGELTGFGDTDAGVTVLQSGPYDLSFDSTNGAIAKISSSSDKPLNIERRVNQQANAAYSFTALTRSLEGDIAGGAIIFKFSYTASGSFPVLGATQFQVNTPENLSVQLGSGAITGAVKVAGAGGSTLLLTFLGDAVDSVRLDLDANGDGTIDQSQTRTADQLLALALAP